MKEKALELLETGKLSDVADLLNMPPSATVGLEKRAEARFI